MDKAELLSHIARYNQQIQEVTMWRKNEYQEMSNQLSDLQEQLEKAIEEQDRRKRHIKQKLDEISMLKEQILDAESHISAFKIQKQKIDS